MKTITPFLWFDNNLEEAIDLYSSLFPAAKVHGISRGPDGQAFSADFELAGQAFKALNGGPQFPFTEAVSFFVECDDQAEVDHYWSALAAGGGEPGRCGWLKDRFGLSWQIVPTQFLEMMSTGSPEQAGRVMVALQAMGKLDVAGLRAAYDG
jgi:predicted 3-demethylubiquinone-9 3-methyltransferase (glyoxalase superfamily)